MQLTKQQRIDKQELFKKGLKQCPKCPEPKALSEFNKKSGRAGGLNYICRQHEQQRSALLENKAKQLKDDKERQNKPGYKEKVAKRSKEYRDNNKEKIRKSQREWNEENREERAKYNKDYQDENKEKIAINKKAHYELNKEEILEKAKTYRDKPEIKKKKAQAAKEYRDKNKEKIARKKKIDAALPENMASRNKNARSRRKTDPNYQIRGNLTNRINKALKDNTKSASTIKLLGCTIEEFKVHLESQFTEGMSWDNHSLSGWHIDHIKPCAKFNLSKPSEQLECFNFKNLQPLWAIDNLKKSDIYTEE